MLVCKKVMPGGAMATWQPHRGLVQICCRWQCRSIHKTWVLHDYKLNGWINNPGSHFSHTLLSCDMIIPLLFEIFVFNSLLHEAKSILTNTQVVGTDRVWSLRKTQDRKVFGFYLTATENHWKVLNKGRIIQSDLYFKTGLWPMWRMDCGYNFITVTMHNCVCFWDTFISSLSCFLLYLHLEFKRNI